MVALVLFVFTNDLVDVVTTTSAVAVIALSLVVVTGYAGQLSLAQFALAGMGAWIAAKLVADAGFPFELALVAGVLGAIPVGVLVGLPALRTRGVNLAVATLGLALVIESQILNHPVRSGGFSGIAIGTPSLFGIDLDPVRHPERYALFAFVRVLRARAAGREPPAEPRRTPAHRGAHQRARRRRARHQRVRRQALRVRARRRDRRRRRRAHRVPAPDRGLLSRRSRSSSRSSSSSTR